MLSLSWYRILIFEDHNGLERCHEVFQHNHDFILIKDYPEGMSLTEYVLK